MGDNDLVTREEWREVLRRLDRIEATAATQAQAQAAQAAILAVVNDFMTETRARNRALPGWLLTGLGIAVPLVLGLLSVWAAGKVP